MKLKILVIAGLLFLLVAIYKIATFDLLPIERRQLMKLKTKTSTEFAAFYVSGNATTNESIQVKILDGSDKDSVLASYEGYNYLDSFELVNSQLKIVIGDTLRINNPLDTFYVKIE